MFWPLYVSIATAALTVQLINGDDVMALPRRLRSSTPAHSTLNAMISTLVDSPMNSKEIEGSDRLRAMLEVLEAAVTDPIMSLNPTSQPTCDHSNPPSTSPSDVPSDSPSEFPSSVPSSIPSLSPIANPANGSTIAPTVTPVATLSAEPSVAPSVAPLTAPVVAPSVTPPVPLSPVTAAPVLVLPTIIAPTPPSICPGITNEERIAQILAILDAVADPDDIRNNGTSQGLATTWIIEQDEFQACPDYVKLVQRWTLAVMYYATNGDEWFQCSANPNSTDLCGIQSPFEGEERFLSNNSECEWAGITCIDGCVTEIEYEQNNIVGTIPTEMGLLSMLTIWGMERGRLSSTIPTEVGQLTNLIFLDFDFNELTGTLTSELLSLSSLTQLDLNDNMLTGSINGIGVFPNMTFLQLHGNAFTGTVPESIGTFSNLGAFTLHDSNISGTMPTSVCNLIPSANLGGVLSSLIADCSEPNPNIICDCCTDCRRAIVGAL